ncbi:hypothetical protein IJH19_01090 [Candidatus Saccharibacteria bacterium]|nr:hypothetical protein [Candidatus Saccharibacteria bacterium]
MNIFELWQGDPIWEVEVVSNGRVCVFTQKDNSDEIYCFEAGLGSSRIDALWQVRENEFVILAMEVFSPIGRAEVNTYVFRHIELKNGIARVLNADSSTAEMRVKSLSDDLLLIIADKVDAYSIKRRNFISNIIMSAFGYEKTVEVEIKSKKNRAIINVTGAVEGKFDAETLKPISSGYSALRRKAYPIESLGELAMILQWDLAESRKIESWEQSGYYVFGEFIEGRADNTENEVKRIQRRALKKILADMNCVEVWPQFKTLEFVGQYEYDREKYNIRIAHDYIIVKKQGVDDALAYKTDTPCIGLKQVGESAFLIVTKDDNEKYYLGRFSISEGSVLVFESSKVKDKVSVLTPIRGFRDYPELVGLFSLDAKMSDNVIYTMYGRYSILRDEFLDKDKAYAAWQHFIAPIRDEEKYQLINLRSEGSQEDLIVALFDVDTNEVVGKAYSSYTDCLLTIKSKSDMAKILKENIHYRKWAEDAISKM